MPARQFSSSLQGRRRRPFFLPRSPGALELVFLLYRYNSFNLRVGLSIASPCDSVLRFGKIAAPSLREWQAYGWGPAQSCRGGTRWSTSVTGFRKPRKGDGNEENFDRTGCRGGLRGSRG